MNAKVRAAILDVDGTLVDSNDRHAHAWIDAFREMGIETTFEEVRRLIGVGGDKVIPLVTGRNMTDESVKRLTRLRGEIFRTRYLSGVAAFPKVRDLLRRMRDDKLDLIVASSAGRDDIGTLLDIAGVADLLGDVVFVDGADRSKPDPDLIQAALDKAGVLAREALMLGDTPWDVTAAARAAVGTVALRCGGWNDEALSGAVAIYDDPADLLAKYERSPFVGR